MIMPARQEPEWDVVVVGAGPAGSTSAALLARQGHRVLHCDRAVFPRAKPCGESINPGAVRELQRLGLLDRVLAKPHRRIGGWRISPLAGKAFAGRFVEGEQGIGMSRTVFDSILLDWAADSGAVVRIPEKIIDVVRAGGSTVGVRTASGEEIRARLVIGADGLRSVVVRRLGLIDRQPRLRKLALTAHMQGIDPGALGELRMTEWGCAGIAAVDAGVVNVVLVLAESRDGPTDMSGDVAGAFDRLAASVPALRGGRRIGPALATGPFDFPTRSVVDDGALLVGDAAGYFDPFTGQGIFRALRGAQMASGVADGCLRSGDCTAVALAPYAEAHERAFRAPVALQHGIEAVTSRPRLLAAASRLLSGFPGVADRLVGVAGDQLPVRNLLLPVS